MSGRPNREVARREWLIDVCRGAMLAVLAGFAALAWRRNGGGDARSELCVYSDAACSGRCPVGDCPYLRERQHG